MRYFEDLIPLLSNSPLGVELFYQVKANLTKEQLQQLVHAHITRIQPGIESLSDEVLRSMRKGVRAIQNIQLLKWCKELGIAPYWNILLGFPGESPGALQQMAELVPVIAHLTPPVSTPLLRVDRFSPNHTHPHILGLKNVRPFPSYSHVYPYEETVLQHLAYYFAHEYQDGRDVLSYIGTFLSAVTQWKGAHSEYDLFFIDRGKHLLLWDFRPVAKQSLHVLDEKERFVYLQCDAIKTFRQIKDACVSQFHTAVADNELVDTLNKFLSSHLSVRSGDHYLSLAVPTGTYTPSAKIWKKPSPL